MCAKQNNENVFRDICDFPIPTYDEWKQAVEKSLKGAPFSKLITKTYEEIILQPMYQQKDIENLAFTETVPGQFPFVRGTDSVGGENGWLVAQEVNHPLPKSVNDCLKAELEKGVNAIHLVLDEQTKKGLNMSSEEGTSSANGVSITSIADVNTVLDEIDVSNLPFVVQTGVSAVPMVGLISSYFKNNQIPLTKLKGCIGADPIAMLIKHGETEASIDSYLDQMGELIKWSAENSPKLQTIYIDGSPYHDGGGNAVQELAYMLSSGVYYIRELQKRGLSIDEIAPSIRFSMSIGSNLFMELAKIRAARMLWANVIDAFGGNEQSQKITLHARTSRWTKTVYDPYVNILRSTVEAFTAAVGGVDSLHVSAFDEAFTVPNHFSRRIARNIHLIINEEAQVTRAWDPAGGSWYIEHITAEIAGKAWEQFQSIEEKGGMYEAAIQGIPQQLVNEVSLKKKQDIEKRKLVFVGATMYPNSAEQANVNEDHSLKEQLQQRLKTTKENLDVNVSIELDNVMQDVIQAALQEATIEQLSRALGKGSSETVEKIETYRATEAFEVLRQYSEQKKEAGEPINVFLTSIGKLAEHKPRTDFISNFFETGGFEVLKNNGYENIDEAINATADTSSNTAVICGKNESYEKHAVQIVEEVKKRRPDMKVFVAGKQASELEGKLQEAGVDGFIHVGTNCYQVLRDLQGKKEAMVNE